MLFRKKGELTTYQLVTIILVIVAFSILLLFILKINWKGQVDKEACHQSVILRGTLPVFGNVKEYVPLKCKTEKICVTTGFFGGECSEYKNVKGVKKVKVSNSKQVEKLIAQNIIDCWSMMGEGKISIFSSWIKENYGLGVIYPSCVVCNRIAFDKEKLVNAGIDLSKIDVIAYMQTHLMPSKNYTYYAYLLRNSVPGKTPVTGPSLIPVEKIDQSGEIVPDEEYDTISTTPVTQKDKDEQMKNEALQYQETAIVFMQITAPKYSEVLRHDANLILGGAGVSAVLAPSLVTKGGSMFVENIEYTGPIAGALAAIGGAYQMGSVAWNRAVSASYCNDVSLGDGGSNGCSVVRTAKYDVRDIRQYCRVFESLP